MSTWPDDDDTFLAEVADAMRTAAEVPPGFVSAGKAAFAWHDIDGELARLVADSSEAPVGVRSSDATLRSLTFSGGGLTIDIDVHPDALRGQVAPPEAGTVTVRGGSGDRAEGADYSVDEDGWFVVAPVPAGPFRLHVSVGALAIQTDWVTITP